MVVLQLNKLKVDIKDIVLELQLYSRRTYTERREKSQETSNGAARMQTEGGESMYLIGGLGGSAGRGATRGGAGGAAPTGDQDRP